MLWVAAIDVGSNAIRLAAVQASEVGVVRRTINRRFALRLGTDVFQTGAIRRSTAESLLRTFNTINTILQRYGIDSYRAVATSAMRDATNGAELCERIRALTGIHLEIIDGKAEAALARVALIRAVGAVPRGSLLVDLGGGSLEICQHTEAVGRTFPVGTVRLLQDFPALNQPVKASVLKAIAAQVQERLQKRRQKPPKASLGVGTGGNLQALARLIPGAAGAHPTVDMGRLWGLCQKMGAMSTPQRGQSFGLRADRADLILPAIVVMLAVRQVYRMQSLVVPGTGLREALLIEQLRHHGRRPEAANGASLSVLQRLGRPTDSALRRAFWASEIFETISPLHRLQPVALLPLKLAALFYDLGDAIDPAHSIEHTVYLLRHIQGLSLLPKERMLIAAIVANARGCQQARYQRGLVASDRQAVAKLAAILRLAHGISQSPKARLHAHLLELPARLHVAAAKSPFEGDVQHLAQTLNVDLVCG